jgi:hypothetical protein
LTENTKSVRLKSFECRGDNVVAIERREHHVKTFREDHQLLALKVIFTEKQAALFQKDSECTFSVEELTRIGIVASKL